MAKNDGLLEYAKMYDAANFFLHESYHYVNEAFTDELASHLFGKHSSEIGLTDNDEKLMKEFTSEEKSTLDFLQGKFESPISDHTSKLLSALWEKMQSVADKPVPIFEPSDESDSINIIGFVSNLAFFVEVVVNRHIAFLNLSGKISNLMYKNLERTNAINKIMFVFRDEINNESLRIDGILNLIKVRNRSVHYTHENTNTLRINLQQINNVWNQTADICARMHLLEGFHETPFNEVILNMSSEFKSRWMKK